jgi:hypothetical protein
MEVHVERALVAQKVANELFATEAAIDDAIAHTSKLVGELMTARREMGLSAVVGGEAVSKATEAMTALAAARSAVVLAHNELAETKLRVGVRTKMAGIEDKGATSSAPADLRRVG